MCTALGRVPRTSAESPIDYFFGRQLPSAGFSHGSCHVPITGGVRRPRLLALVYVACMVLLATTLAGVLVVVNAHLRAAALNATAADDHALVGSLLRRALHDGDLKGTPERARVASVQAALAGFIEDHGLRGAAIRDARGVTRYAVGSLADAAVLAADAQAAARAGHATLAVDEPGTTLVEHLPSVDGAGALLATVSLERDAGPILAAAATATRDVILVLGTGSVILAGVLYLVFRAAQQLLDRRTDQLVEATRRDALTGLPNHGSVVARLNDMLEAARRDSGWVIVAAIDVDGFRLLNETHGFPVGDRALRIVANAVAGEAPAGAIVGRAGPDEFLVIGPPSVAPAVRPAVERMRARLADTPLPIEGADPLALTISAGIASYPEHAASGSELLAVAGLMLAEARTGGGDRVRVDAPERDTPPGSWSAFSVLDGLVQAVDAKDHYTRRHSEQVARYAGLLAERLELDGEARECLERAAVLHDVGKIGIPDVILRKPAALTDEERAVMHQHAVLGDAIVAGLPGYEEVALGIRHHHEWWDGTGYPDRLAGTDVPLIARIISLADVYSALTTARPYRRAFSVEDAVRHMGDHAGSQFDPSLAETFLDVVRELPGWRLPLGDDERSRHLPMGQDTEAA